jgi:acetyl-CoA carboxylase alpha subunit
MPINVVTGSTVGFTVAFFSTTSGQAVTVVPSSATLTITYPPSSNSIATVSVVIGMALSGSYFTATWGSAVAALGMTNYSVTAPGQASPTSGSLRIIS